MTDRMFKRCMIGLAIFAGVFLMSDSRAQANAQLQKAYTEGCVDGTIRTGLTTDPAKIYKFCNCMLVVVEQSGGFNALNELAMVRAGLQRRWSEAEILRDLDGINKTASQICMRHTK